MYYARGSVYRNRISPVRMQKKTRFSGVGLKENVALGEFRAELTVDEHSYPVDTGCRE